MSQVVLELLDIHSPAMIDLRKSVSASFYRLYGDDFMALMKTKTRAKILGVKLIGNSGPVWVRRCVEGFCGLKKHVEPAYDYHENDLDDCLHLMALKHLGYDVTVNVGKFLDDGVDVFVDYFCGDWWKHDKDLARRMDKSLRRADLTWYAPFSNGLLLALLSERWDDIARVCGWVEARLKPDYYSEETELELVHVYKSIAAGLRGTPMRGLATLEAEILSCREQRPRLLFEAWDAARNKDQERFEAAFLKAMKHLKATFRPPSIGMVPNEWIAAHHSVVALASRRMGMKLPDLEPELGAFLISPESLELKRRKR